MNNLSQIKKKSKFYQQAEMQQIDNFNLENNFIKDNIILNSRKTFKYK
jgi:hypothetical protein